MKQRNGSVMSVGRQWFPGLIALALLGVPCGCGGQSSVTDDSETHFLHCDVTSDCRELGSQYICHEEECRDRDDVSLADGGMIAAAGTANAGGSSGMIPGGFGGAEKVDLVLMVDNSVSMADKQSMLRATVPDLVGRLLNPLCVDGMGVGQRELTPDAPDQPCPAGLTREFNPVLDINVAVITSSLGAFGATSGACLNSQDSDQKEDMGHLVGSLPRGQTFLEGNAAANSNGFGFVEWRATGEASIDDFQTALSDLVMAAGEFGCGYEASLESWYRFLIDPEPYASLAPVSCVAGGTDTNCRAASGIDQTVLDQRAAFLRPDSLVAVVMLTDENDCSVKASGQNWYVAEVGSTHPMWRAASICEVAPNDACCYSCGQTPPAGCEPDVACGDPANTRENGDYYLDAEDHKSVEDQDNLRCFHQKQRFGADFLYPTSRYSNALTQQELCMTRDDLSAADCGAEGRIVPNPLYALPEGESGPQVRDPSMVFLTGIVGVPWQDIARSSDAFAPLEYKTADELIRDQVWPAILGDGISPDNQLMVESVTPRTGNTPLGEALAPATAGHLANSVNGHEWEPNPPSDLQYACIFPLPEARDCASLQAADDPRHCDCDGAADTADGQQSKPLCQTPTGEYGTTQYYAKAYPGIRELQVLQEHGLVTGNSTVASICARNTTDADAQDFGYRPAVAALLERMAPHLPEAP